MQRKWKTKHKSWIHKQSPLEDLLKNKKEECYINTMKDPHKKFEKFLNF